MIWWLLYALGVILSTYPMSRHLTNDNPTIDRADSALVVALAFVGAIVWPVIVVVSLTYSTSKNLWTIGQTLKGK